jgi:ribosome recycling factor
MKDEVLQETRRKMDKVLEAMARDLSRVRTGRASVALLEGIKVECYGTTMPLPQVASLAAPESRLLTESRQRRQDHPSANPGPHH